MRSILGLLRVPQKRTLRSSSAVNDHPSRNIVRFQEAPIFDSETIIKVMEWRQRCIRGTAIGAALMRLDLMSP